MKRILLLYTFICCSFLLNGQNKVLEPSQSECPEINNVNWGSDSLTCRKNVSLYSEFLKQKNYVDAAKFWYKTQKTCPQYKPNLYANGVYIYKQLAKAKKKEKSSDAALYLDTLYKIYDLWVDNFGNCDKIKASLAKDIMILDPSKGFPKVYTLYNTVFTNSPDITSYSDIQYFVYSIKYMLQTKKIDCDQFLAHYELLSSECDKNITKGNKPDKYTNVQGFLDQEVSPCASCDKLEEIYTNKYNAAPENMEQINKIFDRLSNNKCTESTLYLTLLDKVLNDPNSPPSAKALFNAATADHKRKDYKKAKERFNRAISVSEDEVLTNKSYEFLYDISFNTKKYKEGFDFAGKLSDACDGNLKKAKIIAASASTFGASAFEKSLIYCLALDYSNRSCGKATASTINAWKGQLLPKSELIMLDVQSGSSQNAPFWGQSVELKTRD